MRTFALFILAAASLAFAAAWAFASDTVPATCAPQDARSRHLVERGGYTLACGRGAAVVSVGGARYYINHSRCFSGARLYFGRFNWSNTQLPATNSLYLVLEPHGRAGAVGVVDGGVDAVTRDGAVVSGAISGRARVNARLNRGTFVIFGRSGTAAGRKFTGRWTCG